MKKVLIVILALLYISTSSGAVVHLHYCMGNLAGWGFGDDKSANCGGCGMEKKDNGCCKDDHEFLKNDSDQRASETVQMIQLVAVGLPVSVIEISSPDFLSVTIENPVGHDPPRASGVAEHILNCVFLI